MHGLFRVAFNVEFVYAQGLSLFSLFPVSIHKSLYLPQRLVVASDELVYEVSGQCRPGVKEGFGVFQTLFNASGCQIEGDLPPLFVFPIHPIALVGGADGFPTVAGNGAVCAEVV